MFTGQSNILDQILISNISLAFTSLGSSTLSLLPLSSPIPDVVVSSLSKPVGHSSVLMVTPISGSTSSADNLEDHYYLIKSFHSNHNLLTTVPSSSAAATQNGVIIAPAAPTTTITSTTSSGLHHHYHHHSQPHHPHPHHHHSASQESAVATVDMVSVSTTTAATTVTESSNQESEYFSRDVQIIWSIIFGLMITIGILANILILLTIVGHKSLHTVTNCFLLNLTVSDLVTLLFNATFNFVFMITGHWPFGHRYCVVNNFITNLTIAISVFTIMVTSKERYNAIVHPLSKRMTKHRAFFYIFIIWLASAMFALPALIFSRTIDDPSIPRTVCLLIWPDGYPGKSKMDFFYNLLFLVLTYLLPLMTMAIAYTLMARVLWGSKQIGEKTKVQMSLVRSKQKVVRMLICVVIVFAVCWLPYHVYFLTTYQWPQLTTWEGIQHIFLAIYWLAMFNSVLNPIILLLMNKRFRRYSTKYLNFWPFNGARRWTESTSSQKRSQSRNTEIMLTQGPNDNKAETVCVCDCNQNETSVNGGRAMQNTNSNKSKSFHDQPSTNKEFNMRTNKDCVSDGPSSRRLLAKQKRQQQHLQNCSKRNTSFSSYST